MHPVYEKKKMLKGRKSKNINLSTTESAISFGSNRVKFKNLVSTYIHT